MMRFLLSISVCLFFAVAAPAQQQRSSSIVAIGGENYYVHTVAAGETLYSLSRLYGVSEDGITDNNPHAADGLVAGSVVKIPVAKDSGRPLTRRQIRQLFDVHTVEAGETLFAISRRYAISMNTLMEDNPGLDPATLRPGQTINIRKTEQGDTPPGRIEQEFERYRDAINSVTDDALFHLVEPGETLYGLARRYGVSEEAIRAANDNPGGGLRAGAMIRIPGRSLANETTAIGERRMDANINETYIQRMEREMLERAGRDGGVTGHASLSVTDLSARGEARVALLLPLRGDDGRADARFVAFYRGVLMGLDDLKARGMSTVLSVFDTPRSAAAVGETVWSADFGRQDMIIGPVYEEGFAQVLEYAGQRGVAVVSPLASLDGRGNGVLYRMPPADAHRYDKIREMITPGVNVIYVATASADGDMEAGLRPALGADTKVVNYGAATTAADFDKLIERGRENIFIVSCTDERLTEGILARISSMKNALTGTPLALRVVGRPAWTRFSTSFDRDLFFKLQLCFVTSTHADRNDPRVNRFIGRYISQWGALPTDFSYRGYDAARMMVGALMTPGADLTAKANELGGDLLQMRYHFAPSDSGGWVNDNWALVLYNSDYTVKVE